MKWSARTKPQGFTLIELLVVIAIIALLAAILFPVFSRARENARKSSCMNNMKQLALGFLQYTQDYDESLPSVWNTGSGVNKPGGWTFYTAYDTAGYNSVFDVKRGSVFPYIKGAQVYICPSDTTGKKEGQSYGMNACLAQAAADPHLGRNLSEFQKVSSWMMISEEAYAGVGSSTNDGYVDLTDPVTIRHLDGINVAFLDGHVKFYRPEKIDLDHMQTGGVAVAAGAIASSGVCP